MGHLEAFNCQDPGWDSLRFFWFGDFFGHFDWSGILEVFGWLISLDWVGLGLDFFFPVCFGLGLGFFLLFVLGFVFVLEESF